MSRLSLRGMLEVAAVIALLGGILTAFNFTLMTPAGALEEHIEVFMLHDSIFHAHLRQDSVSRNQSTRMIEVQTRLMCIRTGQDTLVMLGVAQACDSLGVRTRRQ